MSDCFVLDDWILHDLGGENGTERQKEAVELLREIKQRCDHIAMLQDTSWTEKAYGLMKQSSLALRSISKFFRLNILLDSQKCRLSHSESDLPPQIREAIDPDDAYLFEAYLANSAKALVTTDEKLIRMVTDAQVDVNIKSRDEFLREYL